MCEDWDYETAGTGWADLGSPAEATVELTWPLCG